MFAYLGRRSYSAYLWNLPIVMMTLAFMQVVLHPDRRLTGGDVLVLRGHEYSSVAIILLSVVSLGLTIAMSEISWRLLERRWTRAPG